MARRGDRREPEPARPPRSPRDAGRRARGAPRRCRGRRAWPPRPARAGTRGTPVPPCARAAPRTARPAARPPPRRSRGRRAGIPPRCRGSARGSRICHEDSVSCRRRSSGSATDVAQQPREQPHPALDARGRLELVLAHFDADVRQAGLLGMVVDRVVARGACRCRARCRPPRAPSTARRPAIRRRALASSLSHSTPTCQGRSHPGHLRREGVHRDHQRHDAAAAEVGQHRRNGLVVRDRRSSASRSAPLELRERRVARDDPAVAFAAECLRIVGLAVAVDDQSRITRPAPPVRRARWRCPAPARRPRCPRRCAASSAARAARGGPCPAERPGWRGRRSTSAGAAPCSWRIDERRRIVAADQRDRGRELASVSGVMRWVK